MPPRFVDASVFVHAYIRPRRELKAHERTIKARARKIVTRISDGEPVVTSTAHVSEIANILEDWMPLADALTIERGICTRNSVTVLATTRDDVLEALSLASEVGSGTSDALAVSLMRRGNLREIYSFDKDFDRFPGVRRVAE